MVNIQRFATALANRFAAVERVGEGLFCVEEMHGGRAYARRFFDCTDDRLGRTDEIRDYQDRLIGRRYFSESDDYHLRWNHYLFLITSKDFEQQVELREAKQIWETDLEYARKLVLTEEEAFEWLDRARPLHVGVPRATGLEDPLEAWLSALHSNGIDFLLREDLTVPQVVRDVMTASSPADPKEETPSTLHEADRAAASERLRSIEVESFRGKRLGGEAPLGLVTLLTGSNGSGKTSLLEAVEYLYCGAVARERDPLRDVSVRGQLYPSGIVLKTSSGTPSARLKTRHLHWYGQKDLRGSRLEASFGRFNFLSTDAAVSLTLEESRERASSAVARLLLGPRASEAVERLERVRKEIQKQWSERDKTRATLKEKQAAARSVIETWERIPSVPSVRLTQINEALRQVGWKEPGIEVDALDAAEQRLAAVRRAIRRLRSSGFDEDQLRPEPLGAAYAAGVRDLDTLDKLQTFVKAAADRRADLRAELGKLADRRNAIETLERHRSAGLPSLLAKIETLEEGVAERSFLPQEDEVAGWRHVLKELRGRLGTELRDVEDRLVELETRVGRLEQRRRAWEEGKSQAETMRTRLHEVSQELLKHTPHGATCPLCNTAFESSQALRERIQAMVGEPGSSEAWSEQGQLSRARDALSTEQECQRALLALAEASRLLGLGDQESVHSLLGKVEEALAERRSELDALREARARLERLHEADIDRGAWEACVADLELDSTTAGIIDAAKLKEPVTVRIEEIEGELAELPEQIEMRRAALGDQLEGPALERTDALPDRIGDLRETLDALKDARTAIEDIQPQVRVPFLVPLSSLHSELELALETLAEVRVDLTEAETLRKEARKATEEMGQLARESERVETELGRLERADAIVDDLLKEYRTDRIVGRVLIENWQAMHQIFDRIHEPREFEMVEDAEQPQIVRRRDGRPIDLHQMSSGQRAAYALSLFVALNGRTERGPKLMLFDDPIAHVDDLNVLSFLDCLRDIVLAKERQVLFATANQKLARLFRHKFAFLGDELQELRLGSDVRWDYGR